MYLKTLEIIGFKSFPEKTRMAFEPGLTAIVGPNGCGKSNISDAIRWVLGEQSAKAMRGSSMEDVIFSGTDKRKPLGMAEVSITFSDCDGLLETEYHEVTVTRRVFRSGEGQYFLNRTPCRLKDIHRLFMNTGIGTSSYSFMEQGRIDRILSSRPEDRRTIFEEASGITKFKSDKKEALRKLDQTEANLLRLSDVIREVKRQIGSLQRQAGKARRYTDLRNELKSLEISATRRKLTAINQQMQEHATQLAQVAEKIEIEHSAIQEEDKSIHNLRHAIEEMDVTLSGIQETGFQLQSRFDQAREVIRMNKERIQEYRELSERDTRERDETIRQLEELKTRISGTIAEKEKLQQTFEEATASLQQTEARHKEHLEKTAGLRAKLKELREESVRLDGEATRLENDHQQMEEQQREAVLRRERLTSEQQQLHRVAGDHEKRRQEMAQFLDDVRADVANRQEQLQAKENARNELLRNLHEKQEELARLQSQAAGFEAKLDLLQDHDETAQDFPGGACLLLDSSNPLEIDSSLLLGPLAESIDVPQEYRRALEAAMRAWMDALVVSDRAAAVAMLEKIRNAKKGPARLVVLTSGIPTVIPENLPGNRLIELVTCKPEVQPVANAMLGNVVVLDSPDQWPHEADPSITFVTRDGLVLNSRGMLEVWMDDTRISNPLSRKHVVADAQAGLNGIKASIQACQTSFAECKQQQQNIEEEMRGMRDDLTRAQRSLANKEGEFSALEREVKQARERHETVTWELQQLEDENREGMEQTRSIAARIAETAALRKGTTEQISTHQSGLQQLEDDFSQINHDLTERRIHFAAVKQNTEMIVNQISAQENRVQELTALLDGRSQGIDGYEASIRKLSEEVAANSAKLEEFESAITNNAGQLQTARAKRSEAATQLDAQETALDNRRNELEQLQSGKSAIEVQQTELRMRHQNIVERVTGDYNITLDDIMKPPPPEERDEEAPIDQAETRIAELRTKIEAMGPVNLVAIEEYKELEERFAFLSEQERDLVNSKQQLMDMIRDINKTTTEMFSQTFEKVNLNFQAMFEKLFNGGSAKLVLVNEEDVLECGIEIIARPPGKRLQNVSLLSGGERTMTAVALLFAIYMIKPSPFCLLDELDAALDESNIGRFVSVLEGFVTQSQFVVITHNRKTISAANVLYGITMPERGVSKIVSMKFSGTAPVEVEEPQ